MRARPALLALTGLLLVPIFAQPNFDEIDIATTPVAGVVHMIEGTGSGNISVSAGQDGLLIVDDQFAPLAPKIEAAIPGLGSGTLRFVINTHFHGDHTGSNDHVGQSAAIIAHIKTRTRLLEQRRSAWPVVTFDDDASVHFNDEEIRIVHYPTAHTDGDVVVFSRARMSSIWAISISSLGFRS